MIKSIQQFQTEGVKKLEENFVEYSSDMTKIAEMVQGVTKGVVSLGLSMIAEEWESYDEILRNNRHIRQGWQIVRKDRTSLITSLGEVVYHKTLFFHPESKSYAYLLDKVMQLEAHTRLTEDAIAQIFNEAVDSSYQKGGKRVSISEAEVSRETVMNKIHELNFPKTHPSYIHPT